MNTTTLSRRQGPTVAHVVQLLQTAYPKAWEQHLRNRLGATDPADLTPTELADFTAHVFWLVRQTGIRDPAAWLAFRAQLDAAAAAAKRVSPVEIGDVAAQRKSAARKPVALENSPATTSPASPPRPVAGTVASETTKAEMLSRAKAAVEAGESRLSRAKAAVEAGESPRNSPSQPASQPAPMNENLRSGLQQNPGKRNDIVQRAPPPAERQTSSYANATSLSPAELAKNEIAIGGHPYVSPKYLAGKMGMSVRSLKRRCASGNGPPHVKIAGIYYDRDMARAWAKGKGLRRPRRAT